MNALGRQRSDRVFGYAESAESGISSRFSACAGGTSAETGGSWSKGDFLLAAQAPVSGPIKGSMRAAGR